MKNFVADGRLTSSPPQSPRPPTPSGAPTDHRYTLSLNLLGWSVGAPEGVGGGGGRGAEHVNLPYAKKIWRTHHAKADCV